MSRASTNHEQLVRTGRIVDGATQYAIDVIEKKIPACKKIVKSCRRHLLNLARADNADFAFYYDLEAANRAINFAQHLRHWEDSVHTKAGDSFKPMPWQQFIIGSVFGWKRAKDDKRRFRYAYVEIPRKNGKSFLASVIALYMLVADGEQGAQVYASATKRDQAKIVWSAAIEIAKRSGLMGKYLSEHWLSLQMKSSASRFEPLASDSEKLDGLNPHCSICDELHQWTDRMLWDVIEDAFGARAQPLMFVITTAGSNQNGICYQQRSHGESILDAIETQTYCDETYFVFVADVDEEDKKRWDKEDVWFKSNPCLGVAKSLEYMRDQCQKAKLMPEKENTFKNKQLDMWTAIAKRWLDMGRWDDGNKPIDLEKLYRQPCYTGLDLSSTTDLTASVDVFPPGPYEEWTIVPYFYLPEEGLDIRERRDKVPYATWVKLGLITLTPGDIIDLDFVKHDLMKRKDRYNIKATGFDPWKAVEISTWLEQQGMKMVQMRQGHGTLGSPTSFLEKITLKRQIRHAGHPVLRWMAQNTAVIRDANENIRPDKGGEKDGAGAGRGKQRNRIDGIVATIMGLGLATSAEFKVGTVYEKRGLRPPV